MLEIVGVSGCGQLPTGTARGVLVATWILQRGNRYWPHPSCARVGRGAPGESGVRHGDADHPWTQCPQSPHHPVRSEHIPMGAVRRNESVQATRVQCNVDMRQASGQWERLFLKSLLCQQSPSCCCFMHIQGLALPSHRTWRSIHEVPLRAGADLAGALGGLLELAAERRQMQTQAASEISVRLAFRVGTGNPEEGALGAHGWPPRARGDSPGG